MTRFEVRVSSHEIEGEGRRYIERCKGKTVNASTVSRKWRLLKFNNGDPMVNQSIGCGEPYVIVKELRKQTNSQEGLWELLNICGTPVVDMLSSGKSQMKLFPKDQTQKRPEGEVNEDNATQYQS